MLNQFKSIYASYIKDLIDSRKSLGFKYKTETVILKGFDRFVTARCESAVSITKELCEAWKQCKPNESESYKVHRCTCLNQLSSFLCKLGIPSYIMALPRIKSQFTPYVFSHDQMNAMFNACDASRNKKKEWTPLFLLFRHSSDSFMQQAFE
jgi:hypothetical protein